MKQKKKSPRTDATRRSPLPPSLPPYMEERGGVGAGRRPRDSLKQPGGQDAQLLTDTKATFVDTRYLLATDDAPPAHIMVRTEGWRTGPADVLTRLLDPVEGDRVDPAEYRFRLFVRFETGDERYRWVNEGMWIGSGVRRGLEGEDSFLVSWFLRPFCLFLLVLKPVLAWRCICLHLGLTMC